LANLENEHIICISSVDWNPLLTRKQQVMKRLPKSNTILYVEPPITLISPFKDSRMWSKWGSWFSGIRRLNENIYLYSPPVIIPFGNKYRFINRFNQYWISLFLKNVISRLKIKPPIIWTYMPNSADLIDKLGERKLLVYDCVDEHSEYSGLINKETMTVMENDLMAECDVVFVTAQGLYDAKKDLARSIHYSPNAADISHFMKAQDPATIVPNEIASIPGSIVGFVGVIQDWIDLGLVREIAVTHPEWSVVMVGPVGVGIDVSPLRSLPNVYLLGRKDVRELPNYIKAFDVCINPFKINDLTDKVSPLKFYEYLASGKPIVSVKMPGVDSFSDVIETADNSEGFINGIERAIKEETPGKLKARLARALENSWESRVEFMSDKILEKLNS